MLRKLFIISLCICRNISFSQIDPNNYYFEHLSPSDGLITNTVYSILEDDEGFIWFGLLKGIQRFDGHELVTYELDFGKGKKSSTVRHIMQASNGDIWVSVRGNGLARINKSGEISYFEHDPSDPNTLSSNFVEVVAEGQNGELWIATKQGLNHFDKGVFTHYLHDPKDSHSISSSDVWSIYKDENEALWVGTRNGLNKYLGSKKFKRFIHNDQDTRSISGNYVHEITSDRKGNLWLALAGGGVNRLDVKTEEITVYTATPDDSNSLGSNTALDVKVDSEGRVWVATWGGGLNCIDNGKIIVFKNNPSDNETISSDAVEGILLDSNDNIWTANFAGGVNRMQKKQMKSYLYKDYKSKGMLPTSNTVNAFKMSDSSIWIGSNEGISIIKNDEIQMLKGEFKRTAAVLEDSQNRVWISMQDVGLKIYRDGTFLKDPSIEREDLKYILDIKEDRFGNIWFASVSNGLFSYNDSSGVTSYKSEPGKANSLCSDWILAVEEGNDGEIWIATWEGISCYKDGAFTNYLPDEIESLNNILLVDITIDGQNNIWLGYTGGIARLNKEKKELIHYSVEEGLANSVVSDLEVDGQGTLWVGTHNGASYYNAEKDRFETIGKKEGLLGMHVLSVSHSKIDDNIYFGTSEGVFVYSPKNSRRIGDEAVITGFAIIEGSSSEIRSKQVEKQVLLNHNQNSIKINYSAMTKELFPQTKYYFRLEPLDKNWVFGDSQNEVIYRFLPPGDYRFLVRLEGSDAAQEMSIIIQPPWWSTWWFRLTGITFIILAIHALIRTREQILKQQKVALEKTVATRTEELSDRSEKLKESLEELKQFQSELIKSEKMASIGLLAAEIAHEINNPLNFIVHCTALLEDTFKDPKHRVRINAKEEETINKAFEGIVTGSQRVTEIVKSLGLYARQSSQKSSYHLAEVVEDCLKILSNSIKDIKLEKRVARTHPIVLYDGSLHQIVMNILTNAVQAMEKKGNLLIEVWEEKDQLYLKVSDEGKGIDAILLDRVFDPFFTTKEVGKGTGLGLYIVHNLVKENSGKIRFESELNKGTQVQISFPAALQASSSNSEKQESKIST